MLVRTVTSSQAREALDDVGSPQIPTVCTAIASDACITLGGPRDRPCASAIWARASSATNSAPARHHADGVVGPLPRSDDFTAGHSASGIGIMPRAKIARCGTVSCQLTSNALLAATASP